MEQFTQLFNLNSCLNQKKFEKNGEGVLGTQILKIF
jgi:hypothetical protein